MPIAQKAKKVFIILALNPANSVIILVNIYKNNILIYALITSVALGVSPRRDEMKYKSPSGNRNS
jgi:hypothetical protein